jgi:arginine-tRNA-protein transferase
MELSRFRMPPSVCSYLPGERAALEYSIRDSIEAHRYESLLARGWRRHGRCFFRPACPSCSKCRSLRVDVAAFTPTKSQRRTLRRNADVDIEVAAPAASPDHVRLYNAWHADMHARRGWCNDETTINQYTEAFLAGDWPFAREIRYWRAGRLVGVGLVDEVPAALSSIYFYYDPAWRAAGPGTFSILTEIDFAHRTNRRWLYLGYWIAACPSMAYKANFGPHELLAEFVDEDQEPKWSRPGACIDSSKRVPMN